MPTAIVDIPSAKESRDSTIKEAADMRAQAQRDFVAVIKSHIEAGLETVHSASKKAGMSHQSLVELINRHSN